MEPDDRVTYELEGISERRRAFDRAFLSALAAALQILRRRWLLAVNVAHGTILLGALAAPLMRAAGWRAPGDALFSAYRILCQQNPERSYFLLGHQLALDQRMLAIFAALLLGGIAFAPMRGRLRPLTWRGYALLTVPMAVDGLTQLVGWRQSNWELRTATGLLFGAATVWFAYPRLEWAVCSAGSHRSR